jgi:phosphoribosylglycinamide formyltransferase 2
MDWGTPATTSSRRFLLLGSGELGKEVAIEAQRLGLEVIAVDRYAGAPAMQVAHRSHVIDMTDAAAVRRIIEQEKPAWIVPEIEAIATRELLALESEGHHVVPTARAARLTMDREGIRRLAAEDLGLPTSPFRFASSLEEMRLAVQEIGIPCVVKPTMSSSGKGQSTIKREADIAKAWEYAASGSRTKTGRVIVEGFVEFDYEITLLTVRHAAGTSFCAPIGHLQVDGDYRESWQPHPMSPAALRRARDIAGQVTEALGGRGIFGVELFVRGDEVLFSEVSPRPHDTGLVTLGSQELSQFALHVRAITGLPVPEIHAHGPAASCVILSEVESDAPTFCGVEDALAAPGTQLRLFGKPQAYPRRRLGVIVARGSHIEEARATARAAAAQVQVRDGKAPQVARAAAPASTWPSA